VTNALAYSQPSCILRFNFTSYYEVRYGTEFTLLELEYTSYPFKNINIKKKNEYVTNALAYSKPFYV
jgi:hypothetical protein